MTDLIVSTSDLTKVYGRHRVLERINLQMPSGAIYGFIGANGAGKTTTIRILLGLISASSGSATVLGHQRGSLPAKPIGGIAYLPDVPNLSPWLRGKDALITLAQLSDVPKDLAAGRANSLLDLVGLKGVQSKVGGYSRGMKQRLGIASALIGNPRLLVLDEPTSALDPMGRADVLAIIRALRGKASVLFSSHLLGDVQMVVFGSAPLLPVLKTTLLWWLVAVLIISIMALVEAAAMRIGASLGAGICCYLTMTIGAMWDWGSAHTPFGLVNLMTKVAAGQPGTAMLQPVVSSIVLAVLLSVVGLLVFDRKNLDD